MRRRLLVSLIGILAVAYGSLLASVIAGNEPQLGLDLQGGASVTLTPVGDYDPAALNEIPNIYRSRIDGLGVSEPEISRQGNTIVVNLPGVTDTDKALEIIKTTGKVLFRPVIGQIPVGQPIDFSKIGQNPIALPQPTFDPATATVDDSNVVVGEDGTVTIDGTNTGDVVITSDAPVPAGPVVSEALTPDASAPADPAPATSGGVSRTPHNSPTSTVAVTSTSGPVTASSEAPEISDAADTTVSSDSTVAGAVTTVGGPTTTLAPIPVESYITPAEQDLPEASVVLPDSEAPVLYQLGPAFAFGELAIDSAEPSLEAGGWAVSLTLTSGADGLDAWNRMSQICYTAAFNGGPADQCSGGMAFVLDHRVVSAPTPSQESGGFFTSPTISITGGVGGFSETEAKQVAQILNYGATPVEMKAESAQTVSATLGKDSLRAGIISGIIGIGLVVLFMLLYYRSLAAVLLVGLTVSGALLWSVISLLSTTNGLALTLAGVTGIIVSVGVTIDSYVVFFERLKDEVRSGKTFRASAARGFTGAWRTILAADTVSLIGAIVLFYLSVGSVRGFAFFLGLSTACDLVVAWFFTRPAVLLLSRSKLFQGGRLLGVDAVANTTVGVSS
jgi:preprotein translocase subunit SecD